MVLWVKGSGSDLATITRGGFTGLRLDEILPLTAREAMTDEEMVAYLGRCQLEPSMPRASIETLLHAFVPHRHVDHTHPDAIGAIVGTPDGERLAEECFGSDAVWIPYLRPGFALSKLVADAVAERPEARLVLLAKHGLVTWGDTAEESYSATLDAINRASAFIAERTADVEAFGGRHVEATRGRAARRTPGGGPSRSCAARCRVTARASSRSTRRRTRSGSRAAPNRTSSRRSAPPVPIISSTHAARPCGWTSIRRPTTQPRCGGASRSACASGRTRSACTSTGTATGTCSPIRAPGSSSSRAWAS